MAKQNGTFADWAKKGWAEVDGKLTQLKPDKKVDKLPGLIDMEMSMKYAMGIDPYAKEDKDKSALLVTQTSDVLKLVNKDRIFSQDILDTLVNYNGKVLTEFSTIRIKPLSVNECWRGRRFKTPVYERYAIAASLLLPRNIFVPTGLFKVYYEFGVSNMAADWDNPCKPFQDILQAKYQFNDKNIMEAVVRKVVVKKGDEYIKFKFESL